MTNSLVDHLDATLESRFISMESVVHFARLVRHGIRYLLQLTSAGCRMVQLRSKTFCSQFVKPNGVMIAKSYLQRGQPRNEKLGLALSRLAT